MRRYCKTKDKNGRDIYWQVLKSGKRVRATKKSATSKASPPDCVKKATKPAPRKKTPPHKKPAKKPAKKSPKKPAKPAKKPDKKPTKKPTKPLSKMTIKELKELAMKRGVYPSRGSGKNYRVLRKDIINALRGKGKVPPKKSPPKKSPKKSPPKKSPKKPAKRSPPKKAKKSLSKMTIKELKELAMKRGVYPSRGSGQGGRVLRKDIMAALKGKGKVPSKKSPKKTKPRKTKPKKTKPRKTKAKETLPIKIPSHVPNKVFIKDISEGAMPEDFRVGNLYFRSNTWSRADPVIHIFNDLLEEIKGTGKTIVIQFAYVPATQSFLMIYKTGARYMIKKWKVVNYMGGKVIFRAESLGSTSGAWGAMRHKLYDPKSFSSYHGTLRYLKDVSKIRFQTIYSISPPKSTEKQIEKDIKSINSLIDLLEPKVDLPQSQGVSRWQCITTMCELKIHSKKEYFLWLRANHPDTAKDKVKAKAIWKQYAETVLGCHKEKMYCP